MESLPGTIVTALEQLVLDLVQGRYAAIVQTGRNGRLTIAEIEEAMVQYGRTFIYPPDGLRDLLWFVPVPSANAYAIDVDLWTIEEGRSDLTVSVQARLVNEIAHIHMTNLHVL